MNSIKCVFSYTFLKQIKSSAFKIVTGVLGIAIILIFIMTKVMISSDEKITINVIDKVGYFYDIKELNSLLESSKIQIMDKDISDIECRKFVNDKDDNIIIKLYKNEEDNVYIKVYDNYIIDEVDLKTIENYVNVTSKYMLINNLGIEEDIINNLMQEAYCDVIQVDTSFESSYLIGYVLLIFIVLSIMMYCSQVAGEITYTKTNRVMELLLTSVSAKDIFLGTTLAVGLAGLFQLVILMIVGVVGYLIIKPQMIIIDGLKIDFSIITYDKILVYLVFFILSYLLFAVLNAAIGSLVSKNEDIMVAVLPVTLISCVQLFTGLMVVANNNSIIANFFSYFPFTSAGTMVMRYFMGNASSINVIVSVIIMFITVIFMTFISIKIFSNGVLYYGNLNFKSICNLKGKV